MVMNKIICLDNERFWKKDVIRLSEYPEVNVRKYFSYSRYIELANFDFSFINCQELKTEIKAYLKSVITELDMSSKTNRVNYVYPVKHLIMYFNGKNLHTIKNISDAFIEEYQSCFIEGTSNRKILWRVLRHALSQIPIENQTAYDRWLVFNYHKYEGSSNGLISFQGLSENLKSEIKGFLIHYKGKYEDGYYKMRIFYPIRFLIEYCVGKQIGDVEEINVEVYKDYLEENGREVYQVNQRYQKNGDNIRIFNLYRIYKDEVNNPCIYKRDYWDLSTLNIEPSRKSLVHGKDSINFSNIKNERNKQLAQIYIKHLIENTALAMGTIVRKHYMLTNVLVHFVDGIEVAERVEIINYIRSMSYEKKGQSLCLMDLKDMLFYLYDAELIANPILYKSDSIKYEIKHVNRTVDEYIVNQIF